MSRKEYSRCVPEPVARAHRGRDQAGAGPVVELAVGDPRSGTRRRAAVADEVGVDLVVRRGADSGVAEELTLGAVALVAHVSVLLWSRSRPRSARSTAALHPLTSGVTPLLFADRKPGPGVGSTERGGVSPRSSFRVEVDERSLPITI